MRGRSAGRGTRTLTPFAGPGILSPVRLPIPPPRPYRLSSGLRQPILATELEEFSSLRKGSILIFNPTLTDKWLFYPVLGPPSDEGHLCSLKFWVTTRNFARREFFASVKVGFQLDGKNRPSKDGRYN